MPIVRYAQIRRLLSFALLLIIIGLLIPKLLAAYSINFALQLALPRLFTLDSASASDTSSSDALQQAYGFAQTAMYWQPEQPAAYRIVGQIDALRGDWPGAVKMFKRAQTLVPCGIGIIWSAAISYDQLPIKDRLMPDAIEPSFVLTDIAQQARCDGQAHWEQLAQVGDEALQLNRFAAALVLYRSATHYLPDRPFGLLFKEAVAAALSSDAEAPTLIQAAQQQDKTFQVVKVARPVKIDGADLRWMTDVPGWVTYGTPLSYGAGGPAGFLWWTGQGLALLFIDQSDSYVLEAQLRHSAPPPVEMALGVDGRQLKQISLQRGDNSWETISLPIQLSRGYHTVNLWYLNDGVVSGKNRDAAIQWISISH